MNGFKGKMSEPPEISFSCSDQDTLLIRLKGRWTIQEEIPSVAEVQEQMKAGSQVRRIVFDAQELTGWDSGFLTFLVRVIEQGSLNNIHVEKRGLPEGVQRLLTLALAVPEKKDARKKSTRASFLFRVGKNTLGLIESEKETITFIGEILLAFLKLSGGKANFRRSDLALLIQECGPQALPIVTLISVLVGLILAFVGAVQLKMFGAQIYVANLVGLGMAREMGAMMTGIIMAGRSGAAFAAQLGTMQVNEEIDAFQTLGISPMEFLVLPRVLALVVMLPLLCLYSDFMGILGGGFVGVGMLNLSLLEYFNQTRDAVTLTDFSTGLFKSAVFGVIVAISGSLRGIQCGRSASAVGEAATSAVVTGIVFIVVADAILTVIYNVLGI